MKFFVFSLTFWFAFAQANAGDPPAGCTNEVINQWKKTHPKSVFVDCRMVDWKVEPVSASYLPKVRAGLTAPGPDVDDPNEVDEQGRVLGPNKDHFAGVRNEKKAFANPQGAGGIFRELIQETDPQDQDLLNWINRWLASNQAPTLAQLKYKPGEWQGWNGSCGPWSQWAMDNYNESSPLNLFPRVQSGILCHGIPLHFMTLKTLITKLKPIHDYETKVQKNFAKLNEASKQMNTGEFDDATIAMSKRGLAGASRQSDGSSFRPSDILNVMNRAYQTHQRASMDIEPGKSKWNQPITQTIDITYTDADMNPFQVLSPDQIQFNDSGFGAMAQDLDRQFTKFLPSGQGQLTDRFLLCRLRTQAKLSCEGLGDEANPNLSMARQVEMYNEALLAGTQQGLVAQPKNPVFKHDLAIVYGAEVSAARLEDNLKNKIETVHYTYYSVHQPGSDGKYKEPSQRDVLNSSFIPETKKISELCPDENTPPQTLNLGTRDNRGRADGSDDVITRKLTAEDLCNLRKQGRDQRYTDVITSAVSPESFNVFNPQEDCSSNWARSANQTDDDVQQHKAYCKLMGFMASCDSFQDAADFMSDDHGLKAVLATNVISEEDGRQLLERFNQVKDHLDPHLLAGQIPVYLQKHNVSGPGVSYLNQIVEASQALITERASRGYRFDQ